MRSLSVLLRGRVGIAVLGAVLLGSMGAFVGAASLWHPAGLTSGYFANNDPSVTATSPAGSVTPSLSGGPGGHAGTPSPTHTLANTPTGVSTSPPVGSGQTVDLHGSIGVINTTANTFILNVNSSSRTVVVNGQTSFQGSASSLQGLRSSWQAEVKGQTQSDGTFLAFLVNSDSGA